MPHFGDRRVRFATQTDTHRLLDIYAPYVRDTPVSLECEVPSPEMLAGRMANVQAAYPWLVYEERGTAAGYAYAAQYRSRSAFAWSVETSIYFAPEYHGDGRGSALYGCLFALLRAAGFCNAYTVITVPNDQSIGFHTRAGFVPAGVHHCAGFKFGRRHDVAWMEKALGDYPQAPVPPVPPHRLDTAFCERIFASAVKPRA
ncbi:MAG: GNAT family N-acetyltransferase [Desulfovibrio sp.]|jgi:phosphinothricin acetyltransferase|nr:GNAT family N-acetyltransferase [Desulfovibrio sp.]